jgi:hypothetical protein
MYTRRVSELARNKHWREFPCVQTLLLGKELPFQLTPDSLSLQPDAPAQLHLNQWLQIALRQTANSCHEFNEVDVVDNQIHGEMGFLMWYFISHGHSLLQHISRNCYFSMRQTLQDMRFIMRLIEELARLEGDAWDLVNEDMPPCTHGRNAM